MVLRQCTQYSPMRFFFLNKGGREVVGKIKINGKVSIQNVVMPFIKDGL